MQYDIICFDCDSTLSKVEGIDELARSAGLFEQVADLTNQAMNGEIALQDVYGKRLALIKPDQQAIHALGQLYIEQVVPGAKQLIAELLEQHKQVHIISGGLRQAILPLADELGVPQANVHAVDIYLDAQGNYAGFASDAPAANSGGKAVICKQINAQKQSMVMIGDGKTDLEAKQAGATVIGFGGVVSREAVQQQADYFVKDVSLMAVSEYFL